MYIIEAVVPYHGFTYKLHKQLSGSLQSGKGKINAHSTDRGHEKVFFVRMTPLELQESQPLGGLVL